MKAMGCGVILAALAYYAALVIIAGMICFTILKVAGVI